VDINLVLRQMQGSGTRLNMVILDACRSGRDFAAWLGLTPKDHSTGGRAVADFLEQLELEKKRAD
jgi:transposase